jgi:DNA-binding transcriptional ArsR family regulator
MVVTEKGNTLVQQVDELVRREQKPLTSWDVATRIGEPYQHISVLLDKLTEEGKLAKFRIGTNRYYAVPKVALTETLPKTGTVLADSFRGAFVTACLRIAAKH